MNDFIILEQLKQYSIPFLITGGFAVDVYSGGERGHRDIDLICFKKDRKKIEYILGKKFKIVVYQKKERYLILRKGNIEIGFYDNFVHQGKKLNLSLRLTDFLFSKKIIINNNSFRMVSKFKLRRLKHINNRLTEKKNDRRDIDLLNYASRSLPVISAGI